MELTQKLVKKAIQEQQKKLHPEEDEETMDYIRPPASIVLNENKGIFNVKDETSINVRKSIFDRTALFHTEDKENRI